MSDDVVYESEVVSIGSDVSMFAEEGMLIIFSDQAPEELRDMAVIHTHPETETAPEVGDTLQLGNHEHRITAVGDVSAENFRNLGHVTLKTNGLTEAELPGDVSLEQGSLVVPEVGDTIRIRRSNSAA